MAEVVITQACALCVIVPVPGNLTKSNETNQTQRYLTLKSVCWDKEYQSGKWC